ncbi:L-ascorbate oxidase homolog [Arachis stenosperma]|uniref:L-ascorbate oxidase homolog n=1 Tax=Arachis stenosperma TaxID=217475 RepID=UPI0025AD718C|nr:L-ascorbate oxidase homolog [Arachis stenosperma]
MARAVILVAMFCLYAATVIAEDPYVYYTWNVSYGTISPLGTPQQAILINNLFPGPEINCSSNNNIVVNVFNNLDEPLLFTWHGIQLRKNSWQDGTPGTMCPIQPGTNYTYKFQVKDQIGSYFYFPSLGLHRMAGGVGGLRIFSRLLIPVPYPDPEDEYWFLIGDWYTKGHKALKQILDRGESIGMPDGVLINGQTAKLDGKEKPLYTMKPGKTYKLRICNIGNKDSLNFRIQGHPMTLVETEGSHTVQNTYESLDVHVGQCFTVLVTANQEPRDYVVVASTRFTGYFLDGKALIGYEGSDKAASLFIPHAPITWFWSLNQFKTFRWNLTASAARPNPQGSYHYGQINITRTIKFVNSVFRDRGKLRYAINGVSHVDPETPLKLAQYYGVDDKVFKYNIISDNPHDFISKITVAPNVLTATFRDFIEIIFENPTISVQSYNLGGYSFFLVGMEEGRWSPERRESYNLLDAVSRHTVQVFPNSWSAILLTFDNAGMWNLRSENAENRYLGQQMYISVLSPEKSLRDEYNLPLTQQICGIVKDMPVPGPVYH